MLRLVLPRTHNVLTSDSSACSQASRGDSGTIQYPSESSVTLSSTDTCAVTSSRGSAWSLKVTGLVSTRTAPDLPFNVPLSFGEEPNVTVTKRCRRIYPGARKGDYGSKDIANVEPSARMLRGLETTHPILELARLQPRAAMRFSLTGAGHSRRRTARSGPLSPSASEQLIRSPAMAVTLPRASGCLADNLLFLTDSHCDDVRLGVCSC